MHEFEALEDAVIDALSNLIGEGLKTLESYSGQLEVEDIDQVTFQFPCIYVLSGPLSVKEGNRYDAYEMEPSLIVGDRNLRGSKAAARGDAASPGVYELLALARVRLHRKKVVKEWSPLTLQREFALVYAPKLSICLYQADYLTKRMK